MHYIDINKLLSEAELFKVADSLPHWFCISLGVHVSVVLQDHYRTALEQHHLQQSAR